MISASNSGSRKIKPRATTNAAVKISEVTLIAVFFKCRSLLFTVTTLYSQKRYLSTNRSLKKCPGNPKGSTRAKQWL